MLVKEKFHAFKSLEYAFGVVEPVYAEYHMRGIDPETLQYITFDRFLRLCVAGKRDGNGEWLYVGRVSRIRNRKSFKVYKRFKFGADRLEKIVAVLLCVES